MLRSDQTLLHLMIVNMEDQRSFYCEIFGIKKRNIEINRAANSTHPYIVVSLEEPVFTWLRFCYIFWQERRVDRHIIYNLVLEGELREFIELVGLNGDATQKRSESFVRKGSFLIIFGI